MLNIKILIALAYCIILNKSLHAILIYFQYTRKEIEWYGLTYSEALKKWLKLNKTTPQPLKIQYRSQLIAKLKENKIKEAENVDVVLPEETYVFIYYLHIYCTFQ